MTSRRARVVLVLVLLALLPIGLLTWRPFYSWVTTRKVHIETTHDGHPVRGWCLVNRWGEFQQQRRIHGWFVENGRKAMDGPRVNRVGGLVTFWRFDGSIEKQIEFVPMSVSLKTDEFFRMQERNTPPWLGDVSDQTTPSMPAWMKDDEKWQAVLGSQD